MSVEGQLQLRAVCDSRQFGLFVTNAALHTYRHEGWEADIRCGVHRGPLSGLSRHSRLAMLLTQHSFAVAAEHFWRCSEFHQSGHLDGQNWVFPNHTFAAHGSNNRVADETDLGFWTSLTQNPLAKQTF